MPDLRPTAGCSDGSSRGPLGRSAVGLSQLPEVRPGQHYVECKAFRVYGLGVWGFSVWGLRFRVGWGFRQLGFGV